MKRIVLIGGYGAVGRETAALLSLWYPGAVVVAGRNPRALPGTSAVRLDLDDAADLERALDGADAVVMCVDHDNARVARACFVRGVHYVDVSADHERLTGVERLHGLAVEHGASALLSVGLAPGITNLLARQVGGSDVRIGVLLGSGEAHGPAALAWTLDGLAGLGPSWRMRFPAPYGTRKVYGFPFSDQYTLPRTSGAARVATGMCLDSRPMTAVLAAARLPGVARLLAAKPVRRVLLASLSRVHLGGDGFAVTAASEGRSASFGGRLQSRTTGVVAALAVRELASLPPGVRHLDEAVEPAAFLAEVARWDETGAAHYDQADVT
ncbi:saccharopine dehydrogenase [Streptomyces sp. YC504]|uniref:Saccharopine dehydrogenase n=1 Tax=Streptomyces mesophilus TaxID=1775132 RepID=A0A6G4XR24_9ACTN|nr:saccharopine dehydrogenase NADP-binding domain-containing protein [Streptomyces mesophilus]NGO79257.1 saccharopine dehydrogenase [Streptomyces mesophilus]